MQEKVCPVWVGYLLSSPIRKLFQNPKKMLNPYVNAGMKVLDIGCAMGFFSLPLAQIVGAKGKVICVDVQEKMIHSLEKRAKKAGLSIIIETRVCTHNSLGLEDVTGEIDFALAAAVVHEVPDASAFFAEVYQTMQQNGRLLVVEPGGHVTETDFEKTVSIAKKIGFTLINNTEIKRSRAVLLEK
ncbi:MAG: class I SAM-dependent methyltransferase [Candidatus Cloacimonetes bacterium]|nr:class I SAM-dependent methyltransferase [Candidatus Cloacimonadota bacterium]